VAAAHAEADRASLCYGLPGGWPPLREATARHLALTRGIGCGAEQVIILNGPLQAFDLIVRVLLEPGDPIVVERPGYMSITRHVGLPPLDLRGAPVDDEGLDVAAARRECPAPALIYVHPLHQYPTGARLSPPRRAELLGWARESRAWVIEGDHLGEIVHDGAVPPALMRSALSSARTSALSAPSAAPRPTTGPARPRAEAGAVATGGDGQVLFLGTFNGVMFPGLRLSYLVVPPRLVAAFTAVRGLFGDHPPVGPQQALAAFIDRGHLGAHLRRMRGVYRERRDAMLAAARRHLPDEVRLGPLLGGTHGCLHLPAGCADEPLAQRLADAGFGIEMVSKYSWPLQGRPGIVLGYGADDLPGIDSGMRELAAIVREAIAARPRLGTARAPGGLAVPRSVASGRA
jgi:GntR family transcriptional regulator/MocR family aminotransferase